MVFPLSSLLVDPVDPAHAHPHQDTGDDAIHKAQHHHHTSGIAGQEQGAEPGLDGGVEADAAHHAPQDAPSQRTQHHSAHGHWYRHNGRVLSGQWDHGQSCDVHHQQDPHQQSQFHQIRETCFCPYHIQFLLLPLRHLRMQRNFGGAPIRENTLTQKSKALYSNFPSFSRQNQPGRRTGGPEKPRRSCAAGPSGRTQISRQRPSRLLKAL